MKAFNAVSHENSTPYTTSEPTTPGPAAGSAVTAEPRNQAWLTTGELAHIIGISDRAVRKNCRKNYYKAEYQRLKPGPNGQQWQVCISSPQIPAETRIKYFEANQASPIEDVDPNVDSEIYSSAPVHARRKADKYMNLLRLSEGLNGRALRDFVATWNAQHPDQQTSYPRIMDARAQYKEYGITGLLGKWGKNSGKSTVPDNLYEHFRVLYLKQGAPGLASCWKQTLGYAAKLNPDMSADQFPSVMAFHRRVQREELQEAVYAARYGMKAANRKYNLYLKRDYANVLAGEVWVSDHCQIDIATSYLDAQGRLRYCFPWCTVWRDYKSGKWLGWIIRPEPPSSDPIFSSMYRAGVAHGICSYTYLDNGKDYRCKDFAGGRSIHKLDVDEYNFRSLTGSLQITPIFAWPYNAQSKPVERDFLRNKEWLSKHARGYRGGNVVERPEGLNDKVRKNEIDTIQDLEGIFETFVTQVINRSEVKAGHRAGQCPDEIWEKEAPEAARKGMLKRVSADALKLFCARTSRDMSIGRRGVRDSDLGVDYYDVWMEALKGRKVYLRRDPRAYEDAWVFDAADNSYLGKAALLTETPALARTDVEKAQLEQDIRLRRRAQGIIRSYARVDGETPLQEKVEHMARATKLLNDARGYTPSEKTVEDTTYVATQMDRVLATEKAKQRVGTIDLTPAIPEEAESREEFDVWSAYA